LAQERKLSKILVMAVLAGSVAACSAQPAVPSTTMPAAAAPATAAPVTAAPAIVLVATAAPSPTPPATAAARIEQSPLQPGTGVSPLQPLGLVSYVPAPAADCEALRKSVGDTLKANAQTETAGFRDYVQNVTGQGCMISLRGTGKDFPGFVQVAQQLEQLFVGQGWTVDQAYAADSPTGTLFGLRRANQLALVDVGWIATSDVICPKDQPISACDIKPEQQNYVIMVNVAEAR
jgi:hypothetical protein